MVRPPTPPTPPTPAGPSVATSDRPRIALAHDWLCGYRGGEAVLDRIARCAGSIGRVDELYVMFDDGRRLTPAIDSLAHRSSFLNMFPGGPGPLRRWLLPLYPAAVGQLSGRLAREHRVRPINLLISTSSAAIKGLLPPARPWRGGGGAPVPHLCYCHSPARYLWSQTEEYARGSRGGLRSLGLDLFGDRLRRWDKATADERHVTRFLANSTHTAAEIQRCYEREAVIVHPPVRTGYFRPGLPQDRGSGKFWLIAGALEPYKRIDLAIEAARRAGKRLVIAGTGSQEQRLRSIAGDNVTFAGRVPDSELRRLYRTAELLLFPQVEDFGIIAVEAMACGLPVVARRAGGALDTVIDGVTGALFDEPTVASLLQAAERTPRDAAEACRAQAERFSEERFDAEIMDQISAILSA